MLDEEWWPPRDEVECRMGCSGGLMPDEAEGPPSSPRAPCKAPCRGAGRVPLPSGPPSPGGGGGGSAVAARKSAGDSPWTKWGKGVEAGGW